MPKDTSPGAGHNSIEVIEADFLKFLADLEDLDAKIKVLTDQRKKHRKTMRAAGIRLTEFDAFRKFSDMTRGDVQDHFTHLKQYMEWGRIPIGTQFDLNLDDPIDDDEDDEQIIQRAVSDATQAGFMAGLKNMPDTENPHDGNTEAGQAWIKAHHDGLERRKHELSFEPMSEDDDADDD